MKISETIEKFEEEHKRATWTISFPCLPIMLELSGTKEQKKLLEKKCKKEKKNEIAPGIPYSSILTETERSVFYLRTTIEMARDCGLSVVVKITK